MATGDEEIIRSVSGQRTTTNNESLKRYLFVIFLSSVSWNQKYIFLETREFNFLWILLCEAIVLILFYGRVITKCLKVISVYLPTGLFYSPDSGTKNGKQTAKSHWVVILPTRTWRVLIDSNQSQLHQTTAHVLPASMIVEKNTEVLFITILNNWQRS